MALLGFFVIGVAVAVGAELFQLHATGGVAAVLLGGVAGHAGGTLVDISPTLGAFQGNYNANVFTLSHGGTPFCCYGQLRITGTTESGTKIGNQKLW